MVISPKTIIIPVFEAVSQATFEYGSCSRHASSCIMGIDFASEIRDQGLVLWHTHDSVRNLVTDFVCVVEIKSVGMTRTG